MKSPMHSRIALAAMMLAGTLFLAAPSVRADETLKVAICNPLTVITSIKEYKDLKDQITKESAVLKSQADQAQADINTMQTNLKLLTPGSKQYNDLRQKLLETGIADDTKLRLSEAQEQQEMKDLTVKLFKTMNETIASIATAQKITLVLPDHHLADEDLDKITDSNTLNAALLQNTILFSDPKLDITKDVIAAMDAAYISKH